MFLLEELLIEKRYIESSLGHIIPCVSCMPDSPVETGQFIYPAAREKEREGEKERERECVCGLSGDRVIRFVNSPSGLISLYAFINACVHGALVLYMSE